MHKFQLLMIVLDCKKIVVNLVCIEMFLLEGLAAWDLGRRKLRGALCVWRRLWCRELPINKVVVMVREYKVGNPEQSGWSLMHVLVIAIITTFTCSPCPCLSFSSDYWHNTTTSLSSSPIFFFSHPSLSLCQLSNIYF